MPQSKRTEGSQPAGPAILFFQPTEFEWVEPAALAEWEQTVAERVGITPAPEDTSSSRKKAARMRKRSGKSYFKCGGDEWDGCDIS